MALDGLYISGYFTDDDAPMLNAYEDVLKEKGVHLYVRNLSGVVLNASLDLFDIEAIVIAYNVLQQFIISGGYDITKYFIKKLWWNIAKMRESKAPFTIAVEGIPYLDGTETIKCKIEGDMSDENKEMVIEKTFALVSQIEKHQYQLMGKSRYYNAVGGHIFKYDPKDEQFHEMDIEEELRRKTRDG